MRIREFESCVSVIMPSFSFGFLIHHAFNIVARAPETHALGSPSGVSENQLSSTVQLRQAFQHLVIAARVTVVFELHKRFQQHFTF
jgi:hypothetical protein